MKRIKGSALKDGIHHDHHHCESINRKEFLSRLGLFAAGSAFMLGGAPVQALQSNSLFKKLAELESDRVLVLIQLDGGNDGLNTFVPIENDLYYNTYRETLNISKTETIKITDTIGMHPSMSPLQNLWSDGKMGVIQNVGYPDSNLSHFRSTDIWTSASDAQEVLETGWVGRFLDNQFPDFSEAPSENPLAVQIGGASSLLFKGPEINMGMVLSDVDLLQQLVEEGTVYSLEHIPDTVYGSEIEFARTQANSSYRYADAIKTSYDASSTQSDFDNTNLSTGLAIVSRLIKGDLGSKIYLVSLPGFDTHANQPDAHALLLNQLSNAVSDFYDDLASDGKSQNVLIATFSEFGRRVYQNNSAGTDHGTAAPLMVFGDAVEGGVFGSDPKLNQEDLDEFGNMAHEYDFREVYATLLSDWFELDQAETMAALGGDFTKIPFVNSEFTVSNESEGIPGRFQLHQNYPNPFNPTTTISFSLSKTERVRLQVFDIQGKLIQTLANRNYASGSHRLSFDASNLASGVYVYRLTTGSEVQTKTMTLIK